MIIPAQRRPASIAVVIRLVGAGRRHADVVGLLLAHLGELGAELFEVEHRDLLVEVLGQFPIGDMVWLDARYSSASMRSR